MKCTSCNGSGTDKHNGKPCVQCEFRTLLQMAQELPLDQWQRYDQEQDPKMVLLAHTFRNPTYYNPDWIIQLREDYFVRKIEV